jgi:hypothetical protein
MHAGVVLDHDTRAFILRLTMRSTDTGVIDLEALSREDLWNLAHAWRRRALRGDKTAHGPAHVCEAAYRRRFGQAFAPQPLQDLRPLTVLPVRKRWRFW